MKSVKVIIIGGGVIGSSIAFFLADNPNFKGSIRVLEKDPEYFQSSTALSVGGFRQQFSTLENIKMSEFGLSFFKNIDRYLKTDGYNPDISLVRKGYLFLATESGYPVLKENYTFQKAAGVPVNFYHTGELSGRWPWLNTQNISGGTIVPEEEGWIDPLSLLKRFVNKAKSLGVSYIRDEAVALKIQSRQIHQVMTRKGKTLNCDILINAAGAGALDIAEMAGISDFPVRSKKRFVYRYKCREGIENCPMVIDPSGVYFRPEGDGYICGVSPPSEQDPDSSDFNVDYRLFEETIWPVLANRVKYFDQIRQDSAWAGHYAYNTLDQNAILGFHPVITNFVMANGFSGHGLQHAPAVGRGISELLIRGNYVTLDLSRFGYDRILKNHPIKEKNVV